MNRRELKEARERFRDRTAFIRKATFKSLISETSDEQEKRIKTLLKPENYTKFFDYYFGAGTPISLADAPCSDFHQSSYMRLFKDPYCTQFRRWFRGAAKSIHTNVGNIAHLKQNDKLFFAVIIGRNEKLAKILLSDLQAHFEGNERYIKDFGIQMKHGGWTDGEFETMDNRFFKALGLNQPFRGLRNLQYRPDFASVDDCEDRKLAKNKELVKEYGEKITGDLGKAFHMKRGRLVIANNYIVKDGINDFILEKKKASENTHVQTVNLCDGNGNPSWHQRYSKDDVIRINKNTDHFTSQREDYNNPIEEGKLFKKEWIKWQKIHGNNSNWTGLIDHWDLSYKKLGDYKACAILGFGYGKIHVLDIFCRKCELPEAVEWHYQKMKEYAERGLSVISYYDATAAQKTVFEPVWLAGSEKAEFASIPMAAHVSTDKHMRIEATLTDVLFNGLLVWDEKLKDTPDAVNAMKQLMGFEKGMSGHDDFPDTLEAAVRKGRLLFALDSKTKSMKKPIFIKHKRRGF